MINKNRMNQKICKEMLKRILNKIYNKINKQVNKYLNKYLITMRAAINLMWLLSMNSLMK